MFIKRDVRIVVEIMCGKGLRRLSEWVSEWVRKGLEFWIELLIVEKSKYILESC